MNSCKLTDFGLCVKTELLRRGMEQKELEKRITEETGLYVDSGYIYKILTGQRNAPKVVQAIRDILDLPAEEKGRAAVDQLISEGQEVGR